MKTSLKNHNDKLFWPNISHFDRLFKLKIIGGGGGGGRLHAHTHQCDVPDYFIYLLILYISFKIGYISRLRLLFNVHIEDCFILYGIFFHCFVRILNKIWKRQIHDPWHNIKHFSNWTFFFPFHGLGTITQQDMRTLRLLIWLRPLNKSCPDQNRNRTSFLCITRNKTFFHF